jgi:transcription elongation GreA/GreB family factor
MLNKQEILSACSAVLEEKIQALRSSLNELESDSQNDSKSSAGDKHETARAMMQLEQEKLSVQLRELLGQKVTLESIDPSIHPSEIIKGSVVLTDRGILFIGIALGKIVAGNATIVCISPVSPLGALLLGKKSGDLISVNNTSYIIKNVL